MQEGFVLAAPTRIEGGNCTIPVMRTKRRPISHFLQAWRNKRGLTQPLLAELAGVTHATISRLENGEIGLTETRLVALTRALKLQNPGDLFHHPEDQVFAICDKIARLSSGQRKMALRLIDASAGQIENANDTAK